MARKLMIEKYDYYKFLKDLSLLPDSCSSQPLYFCGYEYLDVFITVLRNNNPLKLTCFIYRKPAARKNSFATTILCYSFIFDIDILKMLFLDSEIQTVKDAFDKLTISDKIVKELFDDLLTLDMRECQENFT